MNILYCGDSNIKKGLLLSVMSLLKHTERPLCIYVFTANIVYGGDSWNALEQETVDFIDKEVKKHNPQGFAKRIDLSEFYKRDLPSANIKTRFTPCCMLRLFADEVANMPDKLLYLDYDVVCRDNFDEFYDTDIEQYELAGVLDYYGRWFFRKHLFSMDYINSGVLLLNMKKIKETGLFGKCRNLLKEKWMFMPDQSAINQLCEHKLLLPRVYNEQRKLHDNTVFQHFTTSFRLLWLPHTVKVKPWEIEKLHSVLKIHEYDELLQEFVQKFQVLTTNKLTTI